MNLIIRFVNSMVNRSCYIFIFGFSALMSACGGGGTGTTAGPVTSSSIFQVRSAWVNNFNDSHTLPYTVSGSISGTSVVGVGAFSQSGATSGSFEGVTSLQKTETAVSTLSGNGITIPLSISTSSYVDSNYVPLGSSGITYAVVTGPVNLPQTGVIGDAGTLFTENLYLSSANRLPLGTSVTTFSLEPDMATTALLKLIETQKNTSGATTSTTTVTFRITPAGGLTRVFEANLLGSTTLTYSY